MDQKRLKPWLNKDGSKKSLDELKDQSKSWTPEEWEEYLTSQERPLAEDRVLAPEIMETFSAAECANMIFTLADDEKHSLLKAALKVSVLTLAPHKRRVITKYFWESKTLQKIAEETNVSRPAVHKALKEGLEQLKDDLTTGAFERRVRAAKELLAM